MRSLIIATLAFTLTACFAVILIAPLTVHAADPVQPTSLIIPKSAGGCDPASFDLKDGGTGCGVDDFILLIKRIITWLSFLIIPLAAVFIGWGAFGIMTAAGSSEKVNAGRKKIIIAITGIVILLVSYLVVQGIFNLLQVKEEFRPNGTSGKI
jgi:hypothetical protein